MRDCVAAGMGDPTFYKKLSETHAEASERIAKVAK